MSIFRHVPNFITCLNLVCGFIGIIYSFEDTLISSYLIFLACFFDFIDGFAARLLKASSPIGKELDSLADMVSFGVLPGLIAYHLINLALIKSAFAGKPGSEYIAMVAVLIPVFSALRLAKFNIDTRQSYGFIGLPTPANALFFASLPFIVQANSWGIFSNNYFLVALVILMSGLLVAEIPLLALKFQSYSFSKNADKYLFLILSAALIIFLGVKSIPFIIIIYILISLFVKKKTVQH